MLAGDPDEAAEQAEEFLEEKPLSAFCDEVLGRALRLAQLDHNRGKLDHLRRVRIKETIEELLERLQGTAAPGAQTEPPASSGRLPTPVLCIAGRGTLDEASALVLAHLLHERGIAARVVSSRVAPASGDPSLDELGDGPVICACYLDAGSFGGPRFLMRRLRRRFPPARIVVAFWGLDGTKDGAAATGADRAVTSFSAAAAAIAALIGGSDQANPALPPAAAAA